MGIYEEELQNEVNGHEISYTFVISILEVIRGVVMDDVGVVGRARAQP